MYFQQIYWQRYSNFNVSTLTSFAVYESDVARYLFTVSIPLPSVHYKRVFYQNG